MDVIFINLHSRINGQQQYHLANKYTRAYATNLIHYRSCQKTPIPIPPSSPSTARMARPTMAFIPPSSPLALTSAHRLPSIASCTRAPPVAVFGFNRDKRRARDANARRALWTHISALRRQQHAAVADQRFSDAARLRDRIQSLELSDPYVSLRRQMDAAASDNRFRRAAVLRDALAKIEQPPIVLDHADVDFGAWRDIAHRRVCCTTVSNAVSVELEVFYDVDRSGRQRTANLAIFGTRIRVRNVGEHIVQLIGRKFAIESFVMSQTKHVEGWGVGGERRQPVLAPNEEFVFESAAPVTLYGLVPVPSSSPSRGRLAERERDVESSVVIGAISGALEFCSGELGQEVFWSDIGECFLVLPM